MKKSQAPVSFFTVIFALVLSALYPVVSHGAPAAPGNYRYTLNGSLMTFNWDVSSGAAGYLFSVGFQPGVYANTADIGNVTQLGPVDISAVPANTYYLAVKAYGSGQESPYSNEIVIVWPPAPQNLRYGLNGSLMTFYWDSVAGASSYLFSVGFAAGTYADTADFGNVTQLGPFDISLVPSGTYYLTVQSVTGGAVSSHSNEVAVKISPPGSQPVNISTVADALFTGLYKITPELTQTIISTLQSEGIDGLANLAAALSPGHISEVPNGILVNYGSGYITTVGDVLTGSVVVTHSNAVTSGARTTGNFSVVANNVYKNGTFIADGAVSGALDATTDENNKVVCDISLNGTLNGASGPAMVSGTAHFDTAVCPNYPISGSQTITTGGKTQTITFNNRCDGTYDSDGNVLATLQQTIYFNANFDSWSRWDSAGISPHYQDRSVFVQNYVSDSVFAPLVWSGTSFTAKGSSGSILVDISGTVSADGRTLVSMSGSFGIAPEPYFLAAHDIPLESEMPGVGATFQMSGPGLESNLTGIGVGWPGYTYVDTIWTDATVPPTLRVIFSTLMP